MITVHYIVHSFDGDYALLMDENNNENRVAIALLPEGIRTGSRIKFENFEYTIE